MLLKRSLKLSPNTLNIRKRQLQGKFSFPSLPYKVIGPLILVIVLLIALGSIFQIKSISCSTETAPCPDEITYLFTPLNGQFYFGLNTKQLTDSVKDKFPIDEVIFSYQFPQKLNLKVKGWQNYLSVSSYQITPLPALSLDLAYQSSESASWRKPSLEISTFTTEMSPQSVKLWKNGLQNPDSSSSSSIIEIYSETPTQEALSHLYQIVDLANKYLSSPQITLFGSRIFLSQTDLPDIIIFVPTDLIRVESALQSIGKLYTIKQDAKVIDLSFKHPILK